MRLRRLFEKLYNPDRDIQERLFFLITPTALFGLALLWIIELVTDADIREKVLLGLSVLLFAVIVAVSIRLDRVRWGINALAFLAAYVVVPVTFFTGGGIYGGAPLWIVFSVMFVSILTKGRARTFFLVSSAAISLAVYLISYLYPQFVAMRTQEDVFYNSEISVLLVGTMVSLFVIFQIEVYREENRRSEARGEKISQLVKSQNQFFSNMSHELRTPINTIIGFNEMILRENTSDEVAEDAVNIQAASRLLLNLINDILDMSKIESGKMELMPVNYRTGDMLSDVVGMLWLRAREKGLAFRVDVDPALPAELYGDEMRIKQVLINVLTNAIKYTKEGSVSLSVQFELRDGDTALVTYAVSDTGQGIKKEELPYLFSAFRRVDAEKNRYIEGTGLGLSIVKQFVDMMGGSVTVNSVYTQGSTFLVTIPQKVVGSGQLGRLNIETRHVEERRKRYRRSFEAPDARVLVVDDNSANLLVTTKLLRETKIAVDTAESGAEALKKTFETRYHVILLDHMMPEMDGVECLHEIRGQVGGLCREARVAALTANAGSEMRELYAREGFDGYLVKPVSGEELERELRRLLPQELVRESGPDEGGGLNVTAQLEQKRLPLVITTDSICDLPRQELKKREIEAIPYHIRTENGVFLDGVEAETEEVLERLAEGRGGLYSEPPSVEEYEAFFARQLKRANRVVHIALTGGLHDSGCNAAREAAKMFGNVTVIDSRHVTSAVGLLALAADDMAKGGQDAEQIAAEVEKLCREVSCSFIVSDTEYMTNSGRLNHSFNIVANAFLLHPVLGVKSGRLVVKRIYLGAKKLAWKRYVASALRPRGRIDRTRLFIPYVGVGGEDLKEIEAEVRKRVEFGEIIFQKAAPATSVNCGPGTFGLVFRTLD